MTIEQSRADLWRTVADGIAAGCPIPYSTYIAEAGRYATLAVSSDEAVLAWAHHLNIPTIKVRIYPTNSEPGWQRTCGVEHGDMACRLEISSSTEITAGPRANDTYRLRCCDECGTPMTTHMPVFPEAFRLCRPYHCPTCGRWYHLDVTDPEERDLLWALVDNGNDHLYTPVPTATGGAT